MSDWIKLDCIVTELVIRAKPASVSLMTFLARNIKSLNTREAFAARYFYGDIMAEQDFIVVQARLRFTLSITLQLWPLLKLEAKCSRNILSSQLPLMTYLFNRCNVIVLWQSYFDFNIFSIAHNMAHQVILNNPYSQPNGDFVVTNGPQDLKRPKT